MTFFQQKICDVCPIYDIRFGGALITTFEPTKKNMLISPDCSKYSFDKNYFEIRISQPVDPHCTKNCVLDYVLDIPMNEATFVSATPCT